MPGAGACRSISVGRARSGGRARSRPWSVKGRIRARRTTRTSEMQSGNRPDDIVGTGHRRGLSATDAEDAPSHQYAQRHDARRCERVPHWTCGYLASLEERQVANGHSLGQRPRLGTQLQDGVPEADNQKETGQYEYRQSGRILGDDRCRATSDRAHYQSGAASESRPREAGHGGCALKRPLGSENRPRERDTCESEQRVQDKAENDCHNSTALAHDQMFFASACA